MTEKRRPEDGRPRLSPLGTKHVSITLPLELIDLFKELGGSRWIRLQLEKIQIERTKESFKKSKD